MVQAASSVARLAPDERRRQILECARQVLEDSPSSELSMDEVAKAAGVTRGLLHHYFGTKRELHVELVREMFRGGQPPVPEYVAGVGPQERLAESVRRWLEMVQSNSRTWLVALSAGAARDPEISEIVERVRESAVDNVIAVLGIGPAADAGPEVRGLIRAYGGFAEAATREWLERGRFTAEQMQELLTSSLLALVGDVLPRVLT
jgi:AcrR family transcriptional regulator